MATTRRMNDQSAMQACGLLRFASDLAQGDTSHAFDVFHTRRLIVEILERLHGRRELRLGLDVIVLLIEKRGSLFTSISIGLSELGIRLVCQLRLRGVSGAFSL